ncbi:hypothetical protein GCM10027446_15360 [Angustibacter peucedani]
MRWREDDGQITLLAIGYFLVALCLVAVVADATAVHLARTQLQDAADAAALDAADALTGSSVYSGGVTGESVPLTDRGVRAQAEEYLTSYERPSRLEALVLGDGTGTDDGRSATVELSARARLPIAAPVVASFTGGITVRVRSTARARIEP